MRRECAHLVVGQLHITLERVEGPRGVYWHMLEETIDDEGLDHPHAEARFDTAQEAWEAFKTSIGTLTPNLE